MERTKEEQIMRMLCHIHGMSKRMPRLPALNREEGAEGTPPSFHGHGMGRVLGILNDSGDCSQAVLARELDIRPQSLSEVLVKLEEDGFICRTPSPTDKRQTIVSITETGKARVADFRERHRRRAEEFLKTLSPEEKDTLAYILEKLIEANKDADKTE